MSDTGPPVNRETVPVERLRRRCFAIINEAGLTDADRRALAAHVLGRSVRSFTEFDRDDWLRLQDALVGWHGVRELRRQNGLEAPAPATGGTR